LQATQNLANTNNYSFTSSYTNQNQLQKPLKAKADQKPEVFFAGQIAEGFNFNCSEGLCCELLIHMGDDWDMLSPAKVMQTHTCYAEPGYPFAWSHPFELYFAPGDLYGWPKGLIRVWRLDEANKLDLFSYGVFNFPRLSGFNKIEC
jgi:B9 domain-containing protein 2